MIDHTPIDNASSAAARPMRALRIREIGRVVEIRKDIARVAGLPRCMNGQILEFNRDAKGYVVGFVDGEALVFLLGKLEGLTLGDTVRARLEPFAVEAGEGLTGRVVDALAQPLDGKGAVDAEGRMPVFRTPPGVLDRVPLREAFHTGILVLDAAIPIAKGQRELIIGDRMTGKTTIGVDTILSQKGRNVVCIYCLVGRAFSSLQKAVEVFQTAGAMDYTIVVAATAAATCGEQYLAPYTAAALGEYFMDRGRDVFVVFDDLTKHAWAYRQLSLLMERTPGRDAYPGDIFYLHSQLMERAGKLNPELGGGSMTFFPIIETLQGDLTGYVPSNLVSMTDGQIYVSSTLFASGRKPAIDMGLSVSRIGNKVHSPPMKELSGMLRLESVQHAELLKLTRFKTGASADLEKRLRHGEVMTELFQQMNGEPREPEEELIHLYALRRQVLDQLPDWDIQYYKKHAYSYLCAHHPDALERLRREKALTPEVRKRLDKALLAFFKTGRSPGRSAASSSEEGGGG